MSTPISRTCAECGKRKPWEAFAPDVKTKTGRGGYCQRCVDRRPEPESPIAGLTDKEIRRMCGSKRRIRSEQRALDAAISQALATGQTVRSYSCPACGKWHLTTRRRSRFEGL